MQFTIPITFDVPDALIAALRGAQAAPAPVTPAPVTPAPVTPAPVVPAPVVQPTLAELAGLRLFAQNVPWITPNAINRTISNVLDPASAWLAHFTPTANSIRPGRIQVQDAASQSIFRTYIVYRTSDGKVLQRQAGATAFFEYWVGPDTPDPASNWMVSMTAGVSYTLAVLNAPGVSESGQVGLDIYQ